MKYELIKTDISAERTVMQDVVVDDVVTGQEETDNYEVTITLGIHPTDGVAPDFSKDIIVTSNNSMTGFQVDEQRELAVDNYLQAINMDI
jgi:hypothetical protein